MGLRSPRGLGLIVLAALLVHMAQVLLFGHDLIGVLDGHGLEVLPGLLLAPSPVLLIGALTLTFGLALVVVVARVAGVAPRTLLAVSGRLVPPPLSIRLVAQTFGARRLGRAPPSLLT